MSLPAPAAETVEEVEIRAQITRADGTVEDLGIVDAFYTNPFKQCWWRLVGRPRSARRIHAANRRAAELAARAPRSEES